MEQQIEKYLNHIERLQRQHRDDEILGTILLYKNRATIAALNQLFSGEEAFYRKEYKISLQNYLAVKELPYCKFFCFRASAYATASLNITLKAIQFAKKALLLRPDDIYSLKLLADLYLTIDRRDKASIITKKISLLKNIRDDRYDHLPKNGDFTKEEVDEKEFPHQQIPLGQREFDELSKLFCDVKEVKPSPLSDLYRKNRTIEEEVRENAHTTYIEKAKTTLVKWKECALAIDPDRNFLSQIVKNQLPLSGIDAILITTPTPDCYGELKKILLTLSKESARVMRPAARIFLHPTAYNALVENMRCNDLIIPLGRRNTLTNTITCEFVEKSEGDSLLRLSSNNDNNDLTFYLA